MERAWFTSWTEGVDQRQSGRRTKVQGYHTFLIHGEGLNVVVARLSRLELAAINLGVTVDDGNDL